MATRPRRRRPAESGDATATNERANGRVREPPPEEVADEHVEDEDPGDEDGGPTVGGLEAIRRATTLVSRLTRRAAEGVVSMRTTEDGHWCIGVEVVETHRIPDSADILAVYEAELDDDLELVGFRRTRRYLRGRGDE